ncbi:MAG: sulfite exporter TauE/SafE family protein, partial [Thermoplasmata archaeon]
DVLVYLFVPVILYSSFVMFRQRRADVDPKPRPDRIADRLRLHGTYPDPGGKGPIAYRVTGTRIGLFFGFLAGVSAGLLGIGGGVFKVPAMSGFMNVPIRVASATSNFMIGVTAASGALVYLFAGEVSFAVTAAVVIGVLAGGLLGVRVAPHASTLGLRSAFVAVLVVAAVSMLLEVTGVL